MNKLLSILIVCSLFGNVTNNGATVTIGSDVNVFVDGNFINNGNLTNEGFLETSGLLINSQLFESLIIPTKKPSIVAAIQPVNEINNVFKTPT